MPFTLAGQDYLARLTGGQAMKYDWICFDNAEVPYSAVIDTRTDEIIATFAADEAGQVEAESLAQMLTVCDREMQSELRAYRARGG